MNTVTAPQLAARQEAVANADAHLNNVGLPTYAQLVAALGTLIPLAAEAVADRMAGESWPEDQALVAQYNADLDAARVLYEHTAFITT